jgi:hypothetical protein
MMFFWKCKHPFSSLHMHTGQKEIGRDADFSDHQIVLICLRCSEQLPMRWTQFVGGPAAFLERGYAKQDLALRHGKKE